MKPMAAVHSERLADGPFVRDKKMDAEMQRSAKR